MLPGPRACTWSWRLATHARIGTALLATNPCAHACVSHPVAPISPTPRFYKHLGFQELLRQDDDLYLGLRFDPSTPCKLPCRSIPSHPHASFACGVIEGFYGRPWTLGQRERLFRDMHAWGMSVFMYGPKVWIAVSEGCPSWTAYLTRDV